MRDTLDAIWQGRTQQQVYRRLLSAMARPGTVADLGDVLAGRSAVNGVLAMLVDAEVGLADVNGLVDETDWPLLEARQSEVPEADFIIVDGHYPPGEDFEPSLGSLSNPEHGATVLLVVSNVGDGEGRISLSGPGVDGSHELNVSGLDARWLQRREDWVAGFPMGVDVILCGPTRVAAIPRSTCVTTVGE